MPSELRHQCPDKMIDHAKIAKTPSVGGSTGLVHSRRRDATGVHTPHQNYSCPRALSVCLDLRAL
ncbi:hypothetical protein E2562_015169 [Oryza meyeriana var. granulata]|uniref:Uncharacterized protein n=1 Tax=Oryza meyeriana var. granulata TaxID=110450 RepID=A0A6G1EWP0_9ORYZ|nr:hypothetical protein E2562_015169 [Oryza meyeriana var. granulata]